MKIQLTYPTLAVGTISLLVCLSVLADSVYDPSTVRDMVDREEIYSLNTLRQRHADQLKGRLLDVELDLEHNVLVYEFEVLGHDGIVREIYISAETGDLLKVDID